MVMNMGKEIRIALVHATTVSIVPIQNGFLKYWPEAQTANVLDDSLSSDLKKAGRITKDITGRIVSLAEYCYGSGADGILFTCSAFGAAIDEVKKKLPIPVLKPNEAMFEDALKAGSKICLLATFGPSIPSMEQEFFTLAETQGKKIHLESVLQERAMGLLQAGDVESHNRLLKEAAEKLTGYDAVMLAQFSTSLAAQAVSEAVDCRVLTSPRSAIAKMRSALGLND